MLGERLAPCWCYSSIHLEWRRKRVAYSSRFGQAKLDPEHALRCWPTYLFHALAWYRGPVPRSSRRGLARYVELKAWVSCTVPRKSISFSVAVSPWLLMLATKPGREQFFGNGAFEYSLRADSDLGSDATPTLKSFYYVLSVGRRRKTWTPPGKLLLR